VRQSPRARLTLRHGARLILQHDPLRLGAAGLSETRPPDQR
jgi:hypothetical protein